MMSLVRLGSFALIGGFATLLYAVLAYVFTVVWQWQPSLSSAIAYGLCGLVSYFGNRLLTFRSEAPMAREASKFVVSTAFGFGLATLIPWLSTGVLKFDPRIGIAAVCIVIPLVNYTILSRFVFRNRAVEQAI
jgi:putative flippase GtrA